MEREITVKEMMSTLTKATSKVWTSFNDGDNEWTRVTADNRRFKYSIIDNLFIECI